MLEVQQNLPHCPHFVVTATVAAVVVTATVAAAAVVVVAAPAGATGVVAGVVVVFVAAMQVALPDELAALPAALTYSKGGLVHLDWYLSLIHI